MQGRGAWKIATIRGVDLKVHFTLIFLLFYLVIVASAQFPIVLEQSGLSLTQIKGSAFAWGIVFAASLFISIVLHEFGHVIVAQKMGVKVKGITLMMLGGISEMERLPEQKYAELKVSIAGPLVSFALGGILYFTESVTSNPELALFSYWIGRVNIVLGIFNLFPAFPLDGGRVLRSFLTARLGIIRATQSAVTIGKLFSWTLGILGIINFNFILILIALFIYSAANNELFLMISKKNLHGIRAGEVGARVPAVREDQYLDGVAFLMRSSKSTVLPVRTTSGNSAVVSLRMIRAIGKNHWATMQVKDIMEPSPRTLEVNEMVDQAFLDLATSGALPLLEGTQIVGVVRLQDVDELLALKSLESSETDSNSKAA